MIVSFLRRPVRMWRAWHAVCTESARRANGWLSKTGRVRLMPTGYDDHAEAGDLLELGDALLESIADRDLVDGAAWKSWRCAVEAAAGGTDIAGAAPNFDMYAAELRELWLRCAHLCSDPHLRSPRLSGPPVVLPSGRRLGYSYERNVQATALEQRLVCDAVTPPGWCSDHVVYANGMAAIANVLQVCRNVLRSTSDDPLRLGMWGAYFETTVLVELLRSPAFRARSYGAQDELRCAVADGAVDILFLEAVRYDWDLETLDLPALLRAWRGVPSGGPNILVIDTTLVATAWPTRELLAALAPSPPALVIELRSGLKLDQQGLELGNVGVVSIHTIRSATVSASEMAALLRKMRTITGSGLATDTIAALDAPFALSREWTQRYASRVFLNNAVMAGVLAPRKGLFARIAHPSLDGVELPWAQAPFVVCHLAEDSLENHGLLLAVVEFEAERRHLDLVRGSSFGFRGHRFESIIPKLSEHRGLFKIAMGFRADAERDRVVALFAELAEYVDFAVLRAAYPDVIPVDLTNLEP
ncbi:hypothetical protein IU479_22580 [Nocardia abscessus]|nr:hypothetical protein [Nocardia abscessus]